MQEIGFRVWLEKQVKRSGGSYRPSTVDTYTRDAKRVEKVYGNLGGLYARDCLAEVIQELRYSADDAQGNAPNPSRIPVPNPMSHSDYRTAVKKYREYRRSTLGSSAQSDP